MAPAEPVTVDMIPKLVEQRFGLGQIQTIDIRITAAAEIQRGATGFRMRVDQRVQTARCLARIVAWRDALAQETTAVVGAVVLYAASGDARLQFIGSASYTAYISIKLVLPPVGGTSSA